MVTSNGTCISNIACAFFDVGDGPNTRAQLTPSCEAIRVWVPVPFPEKLPVRVLAEQGRPPRLGEMYCKVAGTGRSVTPSLFNTVICSENLAIFWPGET